MKKGQEEHQRVLEEETRGTLTITYLTMESFKFLRFFEENSLRFSIQIGIVI